MAEIFVSKKAQKEIEQSFGWYERANSTIADIFLKDINDKFNEISSHPLRYSIKKDPYRVSVLKRFPFSIVYKYFPSKNVVLIIAVFHFKRNSKKKFQ